MPRTHDVVTIHIGAPPPRSAPVRDRAPPRITDAARRLSRKAEKAGATLDGLNNGLDRIAAGLRTLSDRRRAVADAAARPSGLVSATSGYVRDAAGNRLRPMTPADLQAAADKHYGRVR